MPYRFAQRDRIVGIMLLRDALHMRRSGPNQDTKGMLKMKAAATRNRNYVMKASPEHIIEILRDFTNLTEDELLGDLRFYEGLLAYRNMLALKAAAKAAH